MSDWPTLDRSPVDIPVAAGHDDELWTTLIELSAIKPGTWTLIGGQMAFLHAAEHGVPPPRVSTDLDLLINARVVAGSVRGFVSDMESLGFSQTGMSPDGVAHRYRRRDVLVDVLAPEGLGSRTDLTTTPPGRTISVPAGTQALQRTEYVPIRFGAVTGLIPRPSLLGAIVTKAAAIGVDDVPDAQRRDLALLLTLVTDPFSVRDSMTTKDRARLAARPEMTDMNLATWASFSPEEADRGRAAYRLLINQSPGDTPSESEH